MCRGFGAIVDKDLNIYFTAPDKYLNVSHTDILNALGWVENRFTFSRNFVRIECPDWTINSFIFDELGTLPQFAEENQDEIKNKVAKILDRIEEKALAYKENGESARDERKKLEEKFNEDKAKFFEEYDAKYLALEREYLENLSNATSWEEKKIIYDKFKKNLSKLDAPYTKGLDKLSNKFRRDIDKLSNVSYKKLDILYVNFVKIMKKISGYVEEK